jgi:hypothetical protein
MSKIKTTEDGWGCVPELTEVLNHIEHTRDALYEIKCCERSRALDSMVDELKTHLIDALESLDEIDSTQEFITVDEEETTEDSYNWNEDHHDEPDFDFEHYDRYAD